MVQDLFLWDSHKKQQVMWGVSGKEADNLISQEAEQEGQAGLP